jgi:UDP-N-acetylmuramate dehydrogenase
MNFNQNISLKDFNTFGIDKVAQSFAEIESIEDIHMLYNHPAFLKNNLILGGGSNILLTQDVEGLVVKNSIKGIEVINEDENHVWIKAYAGEVWHDLVMHCIDKNWGGIENLSLIPGQTGAAPMQNIGAYGVELKDVFEELDAWNILEKKVEIFNNAKCNFGYRESIFKKEAKGKYIILSITLKLTKKNHAINTTYGAINDVLKERGVANPTIKDVSDAVVFIRKSKLPDPAEIGNAGSFFKNPEVPNSELYRLQQQYPSVPYYVIDNKTVKIPAGWLIENAGWKGKTFGNYGVHKNQALVLVNYGGADGKQIQKLALEIQADVKLKFGIDLHPEVNFI